MISSKLTFNPTTEVYVTDHMDRDLGPIELELEYSFTEGDEGSRWEEPVPADVEVVSAGTYVNDIWQPVPLTKAQVEEYELMILKELV